MFISLLTLIALSEIDILSFMFIFQKLNKLLFEFEILYNLLTILLELISQQNDKTYMFLSFLILQMFNSVLHKLIDLFHIFHQHLHNAIIFHQDRIHYLFDLNMHDIQGPVSVNQLQQYQY